MPGSRARARQPLNSPRPAPGGPPRSGSASERIKLSAEGPAAPGPGRKRVEDCAPRQLPEQPDPKVGAVNQTSICKLPVGECFQPGRGDPDRSVLFSVRTPSRAARGRASRPARERGAPSLSPAWPETPAGRAFIRRASSLPPLPLYLPLGAPNPGFAS